MSRLFPLLLSAAALSLVGCSSVTKKDHMTASAGLRAEAHRVWHRPVEVSYEFMDYCEGSSTTTRIFGLWRVSGDPAGSGPSLPTFGGGAASLSPNGKFAVHSAIESMDADGFYMTYNQDESKGGFFRKKKTSHVRGKCLKLKVLGEVNRDRADLDRFGHPPAKD
jgi:hypothetical protein